MISFLKNSNDNFKFLIHVWIVLLVLVLVLFLLLFGLIFKQKVSKVHVSNALDRYQPCTLVHAFLVAAVRFARCLCCFY